MSYQVKYNSVEWDTTYNFKVAKKGISGRYDLPAPRDDGFDWPTDSIYPISVGANVGLRRIIVTGRIAGDDHDDLVETLVAFVNAMNTLRDAGEWKELYFGDYTDYYYEAVPYSIKPDFIGNEFNTRYAKVTIVFNCKNEIFAVTP